MRNRHRLWTILMVGVSLGATLLWVTPVKAIPLSNTPISWTIFMSWVNDVNNDGVPDHDPSYPPLTVPFDFTPPPPISNIVPDGNVFTAVYPGAGPAAGRWVYVYQVQHLLVSNVPVVNGMSWRWIENPTSAGVGPITSFRITSGAPTIGFGLGTENISPGADWFPGAIPTADFDFEIEPGEITFIFGLFSTLPPELVDATIRDAVVLTTRPHIYTPTPEPSAFLLLGLGLMGTLIWKRRKA